MNNKFPTSVSLNDTWFEWEYGKFKDVLGLKERIDAKLQINR